MRSFGGSSNTALAAGLLAAVVLALLAFPAQGPTAAGRTAATASAPPGALLIDGRRGGNHVRVSMSANGKRFKIRGNVHVTGPHRCKHRRHHSRFRCRANGVTAVLVSLGGAGDKLEVLDSLPVAVTAHLGSGRDKMIGAGEPDTCFPGPTRRNRCIGGAGNDVCITGPRNSDCVGGPGNDYCEASTGSDGCWGGSGQDICKMGPGHDGCHGEGGDDQLFGGASSDKLYGGRGHDYCDGQRGVGRSYGCESGPRN